MSDEHDLEQVQSRPKQDEISGRKRDSFYANLRKSSAGGDPPAEATTATEDEDNDNER